MSGIGTYRCLIKKTKNDEKRLSSLSYPGVCAVMSSRVSFAQQSSNEKNHQKLLCAYEKKTGICWS